MEFDIYDREEKKFFSTKKRRDFLKDTPFIHSVRVLAEGYFKSVDEIAGFIGNSLFISENRKENFLSQCKKGNAKPELALAQTDLSGIMEGIYIKVEDGDYVTDRLKYVRGSFLNTILDSKTHWMNRPLVANLLADGADLLKQVPQNPAYHAEGDVYCHTGLVCEALLSLPEWQTLSGVEQELLFLAAAFHDIGKITCTKYEDGIPVSPKHTISAQNYSAGSPTGRRNVFH